MIHPLRNKRFTLGFIIDYDPAFFVSFSTILVYWLGYYCCLAPSCVWLCATPWTVACQHPLSSTNMWSLFRFMSIGVVMLSNLISSSAVYFFYHQSFPASRSFPISQLFTSGGQSIGASASESVLPMNIQGWFPLRLPCLTSLQVKGLSKVLSSTTIWKHQFFSVLTSLWSSSHVHTGLLEKP